MIQKTRIQILNDQPIQPREYVLYWMQQSQRAEYNHALEYAVGQANTLKLPLLVVFGLTAQYPEANWRHYVFMLEGLQATQQALERRQIKMIVRLGDPAQIALKMGRKAALIVCDRGYLGHQRAWRKQLMSEAVCRVDQVESDVIVPIESVSTKAEYAARTIRPKINRLLEQYLRPMKSKRLKINSVAMNVRGENLSDPEKLIAKLHLAKDVLPVSQFFKGGTDQAKKKFATFLKTKLANYAHNSNQPQTDDVSHMSMYLHFGQISPLYLALGAQKAVAAPPEAKAAYLEELIVRRELAINFVAFTPNYDRYDCIPNWAQATLAEHRQDKRLTIYTRRELERAQTHDVYWNAAMQEMRTTGFMHNYMRMYWGKKILEWTQDPASAFETTLYLNNKYFLDGRDPNSYTGVAWIYGVHDRAWPQRPIFGKVRYMAATGLERKCDIRAYVNKVDQMVGQAMQTTSAK